VHRRPAGKIRHQPHISGAQGRAPRNCRCKYSGSNPRRGAHPVARFHRPSDAGPDSRGDRKNQADNPEEVARFTLENLANGPVAVVPSMLAGFQQLATTDRRGATEMNDALVMGNTGGIRQKSE
jgi:hypothetical protein